MHPIAGDRVRQLGVPQAILRRTNLIRFLLLLVAAYGGLLLLLMIFQDRLIFFPEKRFLVLPKEVGLEYEDVLFNAEDGTELHGWLVPSQSPKAVILYCHGNGGNISHRIGYLQIFNQLGFTTFMFDFRGYGKSHGTPSEQGIHRDARAAWEHLTGERKVPPWKIVVYGESLGGAVAARLASEEFPGALVLHSAFTSLPDMAAKVYPFLPARWLVRYQFDTLGHVPRVKCPVLIIHSKEDEIVPHSHGLKLFAAASDRGHFLELQGDHNTGFITSAGVYGSGVAAFLDRVLVPGTMIENRAQMP